VRYSTRANLSPWFSTVVARDGSGRSPATGHPTVARSLCRPRDHLRLPAGHRQHGDHPRGPRAARTDDPGNQGTHGFAVGPRESSKEHRTRNRCAPDLARQAFPDAPRQPIERLRFDQSSCIWLDERHARLPESKRRRACLLRLLLDACPAWVISRPFGPTRVSRSWLRLA
jgi:hypothetical protein